MILVNLFCFLNYSFIHRSILETLTLSSRKDAPEMVMKFTRHGIPWPLISTYFTFVYLLISKYLPDKKFLKPWGEIKTESLNKHIVHFIWNNLCDIKDTQGYFYLVSVEASDLFIVYQPASLTRWNNVLNCKIIKINLTFTPWVIRFILVSIYIVRSVFVSLNISKWKYIFFSYVRLTLVKVKWRNSFSTLQWHWLCFLAVPRSFCDFYCWLRMSIRYWRSIYSINYPTWYR